MQESHRSQNHIETEITSETRTSNIPLLPQPDPCTHEIPDLENNIVIQDLNEEDESYRTPSFIENPAHIAKDQQENEILLQKIRHMKLFPIFEDHELAKTSINYFLYLEFYHIAIKLFFQIFLFSIIIYVLYFLVVETYSAIDTGFTKVIAYTIGGVTATFIMKYSLKREDKRLLNHNALYNFQWSEDLFSLLLKNIPKECTKLEIQQYLQDILQKKQASPNATVREIIFVHDYYKFTRLSKKLKKRHNKLTALQNQSTSKKRAQKSGLLEQKVSILKNQLSTLQDEIQNLQHFRGKVIVIFNTMEAKDLIIQHFTVGKFEKLLIFLFRVYYKSYYIHGQRISCKEVPEPHNLMIENLHYPFSKRIYRTPLAYFASSAVFLLALGSLGTLSGWKLETLVQHTASLLDNEVYSYGLAILTMLLATILERIYRKTQSLFVYSSALRPQTSMVNYNMYVSLLLYVFIQGLLGYGNRNLWIDQLIKLSLLYVLKRLVLKAFAFIAFIKTKNTEESKGLLASLVHKAKKKYVEFDFAKGLGYAFPLIFMGLAFIILSPFVLLPIFIASLYIFAIVDKYRMLKQCNVYPTKSARFMLAHFWVYRWAPLLACYFSMGILYTYEKQEAPDAETSSLFGLPMFICLIGLMFSLCCGKPLDQRVAERFLQRNSRVEYESVSKEFSSFYQREDYAGTLEIQDTCS